jgi:hypothetical protein
MRDRKKKGAAKHMSASIPFSQVIQRRSSSESITNPFAASVFYGIFWRGWGRNLPFFMLRRTDLEASLAETALRLRDNDRPPVEELLLALAYLEIKQPADAERHYAEAVAWLNRFRQPMQVLSVLGAIPTGGFHAAAELFKQPIDPRYDAFDWETWHECDVIRAEVEAKLKPGKNP